MKEIKEIYNEFYLNLVKKNGEYLKYINNQTPQICFAAINQNINALKYVNKDCDEILRGSLILFILKKNLI
jgi:hypothetical protein